MRGHFEKYHGESGVPVESRKGIRLKEFAGRNSKPVLQPQNIIRREDQLKGGTTVCKTFYAFVAGEREGVSVQTVKKFSILQCCFQAFL
jgi:hypothetical protein